MTVDEPEKKKMSEILVVSSEIAFMTHEETNHLLLQLTIMLFILK